MIKDKKLPVLEAVVNKFKSAYPADMSRTIFVCVQHLLYTTCNLFENLIQLGANPSYIFLIGKAYSTCDSVANHLVKMGINLQKSTPLSMLGEYANTFNNDILTLWETVISFLKKSKCIDSIIILDEGGRLNKTISRDLLEKYSIIGIEQTSFGLFGINKNALPYPIINVARSAVKTQLESYLIAEAVVNKLNFNLPTKKTGLCCGVVGVGVIGQAVARKLLQLGCQVFLFDVDQQNAFNLSGAVLCSSINELVVKSSYIFGCSGQDIAKDIDIKNSILDAKHFISCSSEDKEFLTFLQLIKNNVNTKFDPLVDLTWNLENGATLSLRKGGFPINFDHSGESVPSEKIQLTRALLLVALMQAARDRDAMLKDDVKSHVMLLPEMQHLIVQSWKQLNLADSIPEELINHFDDINWIKSKSEGLFYNQLKLSSVNIAEASQF